MDDEAAVEGLTRLGLTTYEARVFLALQKLGSGTAAEVTEVVDVPRSQVYGAAEGLEERGLVETRQTTPTVYRPVDLDRARTRLLDAIARTGAETFEYLESVQGTAGGGETGEAIWLVRGRTAIGEQVADLAAGADERVVYAVGSAEQVDDRVLAALEAVAGDGGEVVLASGDAAVLESVPTDSAVSDRCLLTGGPEPDIQTGRILLVDDRTILLSVYSRETGGDGAEEVAFWSADSAFARLLVEVVERWFDLEAA